MLPKGARLGTTMLAPFSSALRLGYSLVRAPFGSALQLGYSPVCVPFGSALDLVEIIIKL